MPYCMIITTLPDRVAAETLGRHIVGRRLAACAQLSEIESIYSWKGNTEHEKEIRLVLKTRADLYEQAEQFILENHPYDVPQIVAIDMTTSSAYGAWIDEMTA